MKIENIIKYAQHMNCKQDVFEWINKHLAVYLEKNKMEQLEIEHIIDYLASDKRPKRLTKMSVKQAKNNTDKWNKALIKKGENIKELEGDIELIKDFGDGFRIVRLIGKAAYEREGFLMRHCVSSYYGGKKEIYSLRDSKNMPHCTMEKDQQIKGKGNGSINPKYIGYIVSFLEETGQSVGDSEMKNLGYINIEKIKNKLHQKENNFFNEKYLFSSDKWIDIDGNEYCELDLWDHKELVTTTEITNNFKIEINFNLSDFLSKAVLSSNKITNAIKYSSSGEYAQIGSSGYYAKIGSSGDVAQIGSSGDSAKIGSSGYYAQIGSSGYDVHIGSSGRYAKIGSLGGYAHIGSSGESAKIGSSGDDAKIGSSGDYAQIGSSGYHAKIGSSGDDAKIGSSGRYAQIGSSGGYAKIGSLGDSAKIGSSGDDAQIEILGKRSIAAAVGYNSIGKAGEDGCLALAWLDKKNDRPRLSVGYVGENIKANIYYKVDSNGNFVEVKDE